MTIGKMSKLHQSEQKIDSCFVYYELFYIGAHQMRQSHMYIFMNALCL